MATTTNFGWETPDDTDLVKDGAAAIRTALGGVDTSFVDLKGGTTGQVLSKASNTDLDYSWTTLTNGMTLVNTTTIGSAVSSVSLNSVFTSTYANYKVIVTWETMSASGPTINLRLRASGTDNSGAFAYQPRGWKNTGGTLAGHGSAGSSIALGVVNSNTSAITVMDVLSPQLSARQTGFVMDHFDPFNNDAWGFSATHTQTVAYDGFTLYPSSGTMTGGKIYVYGYGL
jgi:hypothetical protein